MANETPKDPPQSFSDSVTEWERNVNAQANQVMGTEAFSQAMNESQKAQLVWQQMYSQAMTQHLTAMNVPTRDDVMRLTQLVQAMDQRLARIEEKLAVGPPKRSRAKRPPRTKQPPANKRSAQ